jgi:hypothetical protein
MKFRHILVATFLFSISGGTFVFAEAGSVAVSERKAELQRELDRVEQEIRDQQVFLDQKQRERVSIERDVDILNGKIYKSQLGIKARDLSVNKLTNNIVGKEDTIDSLDTKLVREKNSLAQLIRKTSKIDDFSLVEVALGNQNLSEFFEDLDSFDAIKIALGESFKEIEATRGTTETEKLSLIEIRAEEQELLSIQVLEKQKIERQEAEVATILNATKGQEAVYQKIISEKQKTAAQIRTALFALTGSAAIPFAQALDLANLVSAKTGVRAALILGTIAEESNLGENVGSCNYRGNAHPTRDEHIFLDIVNRLGLDPDQMLVSCAPWYGYGGAMGPAQFIPSTWILYEDRLAKITGHTPPNPWDPGDAFMAAGLLLSDNGADRGTRDAERLATLRYFAGWKNATKAAYAFYGDDVMELADFYQEQIDILANS